MLCGYALDGFNHRRYEIHGIHGKNWPCSRLSPGTEHNLRKSKTEPNPHTRLLDVPATGNYNLYFVFENYQVRNLMANHKSAEKRVRQNIKRNEINRSNRSKLRTQIKSLRASLSTGDQKSSLELLNPTVSLIDKAVNKGLIHKNTAARYKSRLTKHVSEQA